VLARRRPSMAGLQPRRSFQRDRVGRAAVVGDGLPAAILALHDASCGKARATSRTVGAAGNVPLSLRQPDRAVSRFGGMNQNLQHLQFPNESEVYRQARNALLEEEMELRRHVERVAAQRRALPKGGAIPEDYVFEGRRPSGRTGRMRLSELFAPGKDTLAVYSFMFGPERAEPCPGCTHF